MLLKRQRLGIAVLALGIGCAIGVGVAAPAHAASSKYLAITHYEQNESNWCWVTGAQVVIKYVTGTTFTQCQLADSTMWWSTGCPNVTGSRTMVADAVELGTRYRPDWDAGSLPAPKLISEINAGHPLLAEIAWKTGGLHIVTVYGYCSGCNGTTLVSISNANGRVGTGTSAKRATYTIASFADNYSFKTANYLWDVRE